MENIFSEWGPIRTAFTVPKTTEKGGCVGFVHYSLAEDAQRALKATSKGISIKGQPLQAELARRKNAAKDEKQKDEKKAKSKPKKKSKVVAEDVPPSPAPPASLFPPSLSSSLVLAFSPESVAFDKKQLYKKVRKCGELQELTFPYDQAHHAKAHFTSVKEAQKAMRRLEGHSFKGHTIKVIPDARALLKSHRLIVRNLPFSVREGKLRTAASAHGTVMDVTLPMKNEKQCRGFAFIQMSSAEEAQRVMDALNGKELAGRVVAVDWAVNKAAFTKMQAKESEAGSPLEAGKDKIAPQAEDEEIDVENDSEVEVEVDKEMMESGEEDHDEATSDVDIENDSDQQDSSDDKDAASLNPTVFIRNVSFATEESDLVEALSRFGPLEYCKIVRDPATGATKGSAFAKFKNPRDANAACVASAQFSQDKLEFDEILGHDDTIPQRQAGRKKEELTELDQTLGKVASKLLDLARKRTGKEFHSLVDTNDIIVDEGNALGDDGTRGKGVIVDSRALSIIPAVDRKEAARLKRESTTGFLDAGPQDRRNLYLLNETSLKPKTTLAKKFWPAVDQGHRDQVLKDRRRELKNDPNIFVSKTRLSLRYLPTSVQEADIKRVLRTAVERALNLTPADEGYPIIDEKLLHALKEKPYLKQVKVIKEAGRERSKGYAFAEYSNHLHAQLAVRYLANYAPGLWRELLADKFPRRREGGVFKPKAPLVEFATEKTVAVNKRLERLQGHSSKRPSSMKEDEPIQSKKRSKFRK